MESSKSSPDPIYAYPQICVSEAKLTKLVYQLNHSTVLHALLYHGMFEQKLNGNRIYQMEFHYEVRISF